MAYQSIHSSSQIIHRLKLSRSFDNQPQDHPHKGILKLIKQNQALRSKNQSFHSYTKPKRKLSISSYLKSSEGKSPQKYYNHLLEGNLIPKLKQLTPASLDVIKIFSSSIKIKNRRLPRITQQILNKSNIKI